MIGNYDLDGIGRPTTCDVCGVPFLAVRLSGISEAPRLCDLHASLRQQDDARREQAGGSPPREAFREVVLDEVWR